VNISIVIAISLRYIISAVVMMITTNLQKHFIANVELNQIRMVIILIFGGSGTVTISQQVMLIDACRNGRENLINSIH
jgi:hypothetical protein